VIGQSGPHYLSLPKDVYKINVPLRDKETIEILWQGLSNRYIDCLGSDHVNHGVPREQMEVKGDVWATVSGFSSRVEAFLPVMLTEGVSKGRITLERMVEVCCENNAKAFGIYPQKGTIMVGSDADLLIVDLDRRYKMSSKNVFTSSGWTIFDGRDAQGLLLATIVKGQQVLKWVEEQQRHEIVGRPQGKYLPRNISAKPFPIAWSCPSGL
jgi:dihydropyrimidinase/dihydroorotase